MAAGRKALAVPAAQHHASEIITASSNSSPFGASFGGVAGRIPSLASRPYVEQQRQRPPVVLCPARQSWGAEQDRLRARAEGRAGGRVAAVEIVAHGPALPPRYGTRRQARPRTAAGRRGTGAGGLVRLDEPSPLRATAWHTVRANGPPRPQARPPPRSSQMLAASRGSPQDCG